jgi:putative ATPase
MINAMDLFAGNRQKNLDQAAPLAARMRPRTLDEFVGQQHFLGPGKLLRRMLEADRLSSVIFYGPPGTGKTTLASLIANYSKSHFEQLNASAVGVKEVRKVIDDAKDRLGLHGQRTVLFLDEIHRFNPPSRTSFARRGKRPDPLVGATTEKSVLRGQLAAGEPILQFFSSPSAKTTSNPHPASRQRSGLRAI